MVSPFHRFVFVCGLRCVYCFLRSLVKVLYRETLQWVHDYRFSARMARIIPLGMVMACPPVESFIKAMMVTHSG